MSNVKSKQKQQFILFAFISLSFSVSLQIYAHITHLRLFLFSLQVELGANWIHGVLGNPIFEIAVQHGLVSVVNIPKPHKVVATTEDGQQVPFNILQEIYEAYVCFLRRCDEYFLCQYSPPPDINSVGEHINFEIQIYLSSVEDPKEKRLKQLIFNCLLKRETCITGCTDMNEVDLLELGKVMSNSCWNILK